MESKDPYIYRIKEIHKVVDGDTIDASIDLGFDISLEKRIRLAGELPWRMVVEQFNQARPPRTPKALTRQAEAMGLSIKPQGEFITTSAITVLTGYNNKKILNWILSGKLKAVYRYKSKNNHWCISRKALWEFAKKHQPCQARPSHAF